MNLRDMRVGELRRSGALMSQLVAVGPVWYMRELAKRLEPMLEQGEAFRLECGGAAIPLVQPQVELRPFRLPAAECGVCGGPFDVHVGVCRQCGLQV